MGPDTCWPSGADRPPKQSKQLQKSSPLRIFKALSVFCAAPLPPTPLSAGVTLSVQGNPDGSKW